MTEKKIKAYLNKANGLERTIRFLKDEINRTKILAECYGSIGNSERVQTSTKADARFTELVHESLEYQQKLEEVYKKKVNFLSEVTDVIMTLQSNEEQQVLLYKYVEGLRFYQVAKKAKMSKSTMYRVETRAIKKLAKNWEKLGIDL